jgi:ABC-type antimicrobial peptide transport system permease subunit
LPGGYPNGVAPPAYYHALLDQLGASPAIAALALSSDDPFVTVRPMIEVRVVGADTGPASADESIVTESFFDTMRIPIGEGRGVLPSDGADAAIVSETLARRLFGTASPIGRIVRSGDTPATQALHIVGVARDAVLSRPQAHNTSIIYNNFWGGPEFFATLVVRMRGDPGSVVAAVRAALAHEGREYPNRIDTVIDARDASLAQERLLASLSGAYSGLGLVLAAFGLYGLMAFAVIARTAEIGVRMALGATRARVIRLVIADAGSLVATGVAIGTPLAWAAANAASHLLTGVPPAGFAPIVAATLLMLAVTGVAVLLPARRAASVDPVRALKHE